MPKPGELTYYEAIGEGGRVHSMNKPFSDHMRGTLMMQVGAVMCLLPPPPARILECGCGPGWLCQILQKCGYQVVGTDVAPDAIQLAAENPFFPDDEQPTFQVADSEDLPFEDEFDAVLFFDSLHHSVDEQAAIDCAYRALKAGGRCIASETPPGHEKFSQEVVEQYDVTEKDMPPFYIRRLARRAGFRRVGIYPRADQMGRFFYLEPNASQPLLSRLAQSWPLDLLAAFFMMTIGRRSYGLVAMDK